MNCIIVMLCEFPGIYMHVLIPVLISLTVDARQNDSSEGMPIVTEQIPTTPLSPVSKQSSATQQTSQREDTTLKRKL